MAPAEESGMSTLCFWTNNQRLPWSGQVIRLRNPICPEAVLQKQWAQSPVKKTGYWYYSLIVHCRQWFILSLIVLNQSFCFFQVVRKSRLYLTEAYKSEGNNEAYSLASYCHTRVFSLWHVIHWIWSPKESMLSFCWCGLLVGFLQTWDKDNLKYKNYDFWLFSLL